VNVYVRPPCTSSTVDENREPPADTANTRRPVNTERLKLLPGTILPTVLPSIRRVTTKFLPRFGSLETIRRPVDRAAAVPIETAYMKTRTRRILHVEMYFDSMVTDSARARLWQTAINGVNTIFCESPIPIQETRSAFHPCLFLLRPLRGQTHRELVFRAFQFH
jgi:hypothetical protein